MRIIKFWGPVLLLMAFIWFASSLSGSNVKLPRFPHSDKVVHALVFGFLAISISRALYFGHNVCLWKTLLFSLVLTSFYGFLDEFHQSFTHGRSSDLFDWGADTLGAIFAQIAFYSYLTYSRRIKL